MVNPMKHLLIIVAMVLVVAACNLSSKLKSNSNSNSSSSSSSDKATSVDGEPVEKPNPTAAQTAAIANGQEVKWDQQGITLTMPAHWKKQEVRNEQFTY